MYILIFEDGTIRYTNIVDTDMIQSSGDGYVDIIDVSVSGGVPQMYVDGEWVDVQKV